MIKQLLRQVSNIHTNHELAVDRAHALCASLAIAAAILIAGCSASAPAPLAVTGEAGPTAMPRPAPDLRPSAWPQVARDRFTELNNSFDVERPLVTGQRFMIGGIQSAMGVGVGEETLRAGGSAMDAAIAAAMAQTVVQGGYGVSFAGFMNALYYDAKSGRVHTLNAAYNTVRGENDPLSIAGLPRSDARSTLVPGFMAGIAAAHQRFGRLPFRTLVEPSVEIADQGFAVPDRLAHMIEWKADLLRSRPEARRIFLKPDGTPLRKGDWIRQPELAATLRRVAEDGPAYMYTGQWAERFVAALRAEGSRMSLDDLRAYRVSWAEPLESTYRGRRVLTMPPPSHGGYQALEMLNLMEQAHIADKGHYATSAPALSSLMQLSLVGGLLQPEPTYNFGAGNGLVHEYFPTWRTDPAGRIDKRQAKAVVDAIGGPQWTAFQEAVLAKMQPEMEKKRRVIADMERPQRSDCVVAVDAEGNIAILLHTFNGLAWGYGLFVDGVSIPDSGSHQQGVIASVGPGRRLPDPTQPLLVLEGNKPVLASCNIGSWLHPGLSQYLTSVLDFGMDPATALRQPQFWAVETQPRNGREEIVFGVPPDGFADAVLEGVRAQGQAVKVMDGAQHYGRSTYWIGIQIDPASRALRGGVTRTFNGAVVAE